MDKDGREWRACLWLKKYLQRGPADSRDVSAAAKACGFTKQEIKTAKRALGVETNHTTRTIWVWSLPHQEG